MGLVDVKKPTVFVLAQNEDAAQMTRALRAAGYRAVDPVELDELAGHKRGAGDAPAVVQRDLALVMECDMIVMGPECQSLPWAVAIAATAGTRKMEFKNIEAIIPAWRQA